MSRRNKRETLTPELTPLIDMVFLLLVFFLVTSVFRKDEWALLLKLPKSEQGKGEEKKIKDITIELSKEKIAYNGKEIPLDHLGEELKKVAAKTIVNLRVDGKVEYDRLVAVLDLLRKFKLDNISLITERKQG